MRFGFLALALAATPALAQPAAKPADPPVVILHEDVPLYTVFAWERNGNFINAEAGSKTEIPYDAARLQVKVYTFPTGEIRAIRFPNGVRTHRHINQTDTILYGWQAHRVQFVEDQAMVAHPGDFALHQKGVYHSGEEIRRGGGIDLEFAMTISGRHNDPRGFWSLARDHPIEPAAAWVRDGVAAEAIGTAAAGAPAGAARFRVRRADLPDYPAREVYLPAGATLAGRDMARDRLMFVLSGKLRVSAGGKEYALVSEDAARAERGRDFTLTALEDSMLVEGVRVAQAGAVTMSETEEHDVLSVAVVRRMRATIGGEGDAPGDGEAAPLLAHWLCFLPSAPLSTLGEDGHPSRAAASHPAALPRRMWAGSMIAFHRPLRIGVPLTRRSTTGPASEKVGRGGRMAFVRVDHAISDADGAVLSEAHDIVYRAAPQPGEAPAARQPAPAEAEWVRRVDPDPVLLFRYSALTFNGHRIHYDQPYVTGREGYPGLVVHGPLTATLLLHELLARHPGIDVASFRFRAVRPLFDTAPFYVCGSLAADGVAHLFARDDGGALCVDASATLRR